MIRLEVVPGLDAEASLSAVKAVAHTYPGNHPLELVVASGRRLRLGPQWLFDPCPACLGTLAQLGDPEVIDEPTDVQSSRSATRSGQ